MASGKNLPVDPSPDPGAQVDDSGKPVVQDIDPQDGTPIGTSVEPETVSVPGVTTERPPKVDPDEARAAIYASRSAELNAERSGYSDETLGQVQLLEQIAGGQVDETDPRAVAALAAARNAEGLDIAAMQREAGNEEPAAASRAPTPASAPNGKAGSPTFKLNVYGEHKELTLDEATRLLQKEVAADVRMEELSRRERDLENYRNELTGFRDRVVTFARERGYESGQPRTGSPPATGAPPNGAQPPVVDRAKIQSYAREILTGDEAMATDALVKLVSDVSQGRGNATPPLADLAREVSRIQTEKERAEDLEQQRLNANAVFKTEFADVFADPKYRADAQRYVQYLMDSPVHSGKSLEDLARKAGEHVRAEYNLAPPPTPAPNGGTPPGPSPTMVARTAIKRRMPVRPAQTASAPLREPAPPPPDSSETVRQMRQARGQPV